MNLSVRIFSFSAMIIFVEVAGENATLNATAVADTVKEPLNSAGGDGYDRFSSPTCFTALALTTCRRMGM